MMNTDEEKLDEEKRRFLLKHWKMTLVMVACIVAAAVVALLVFLWVVNEAAAVMPASLGEWTVGYLVTFILHLIFWELLLVATWGIPLAAVLYWQFSKQKVLNHAPKLYLCAERPPQSFLRLRYPVWTS